MNTERESKRLHIFRWVNNSDDLTSLRSDWLTRVSDLAVQVKSLQCAAVITGNNLHDIGTAEALLLHLLHRPDPGQTDERALLQGGHKEEGESLLQYVCSYLTFICKAAHLQNNDKWPKVTGTVTISCVESEDYKAVLEQWCSEIAYIHTVCTNNTASH